MGKSKSHGKKKAVAGKSKSKKVSLVKLSNKHLNKLAKQGRLKKRVPKRELLRLLKDRTTGTRDAGEELDDKLDLVNGGRPAEIPLESTDFEYFGDNKDLSFLLHLKSKDSEKSKRKRTKKDDTDHNDDLEQSYAKRAAFTQIEVKPMKALLPIKSKEKGIETRMIEDEDAAKDDSENEDDSTEHETGNEADSAPEPLPALSTADIFARRRQKLLQIKQKIASVASALIENPQDNVNKLKELRLILEISDPDVMVTCKKLAVVSLLEIFKDILPGYNIRMATEKEKEQSASKEIKFLRSYEEALLRNYKYYLEALESMAKGQKLKTKDKKKNLTERMSGIEIPTESVNALRELSVKCMCELLVSHPHFNYRANIVSVVIPFMGHKRAAVSSVVCGFVKRIFKEDKAGQLTLEVVRCIAKVVKNCKFDVHPRVLNTFLSLKIKEVDHGGLHDDDDKNDGKENRKFMSRRDKKRKKQMKELERELEDAAATQNKKKQLKIHTEIINSVFLTYFRILKQATHSVCLSAVLEGLAKFAHLINVDFFDDMFTVINDLVQSGDLTYRECLHCIKTAFIILSGQGSSLNIDPLHFYQHLYSTLFNLSAGLTSEDMQTALECLDIMVTKRRKQISQQRLLAFIKRLTTLALQCTADGALGCLVSARSFIVSDSKSEILYDTEHEGTGMYLPELTDPEHCNAHNTALFDLHLARRHYHPVVRKYAQHVLGGCTSNINSLLGDATRKSSAEMYETYCQENIEFNPAVPLKTKVKSKKGPGSSGSFLQSEIRSQCDRCSDKYSGIDISKLLFHKGVKNHSSNEMLRTSDGRLLKKSKMKRNGR